MVHALWSGSHSHLYCTHSYMFDEPSSYLDVKQRLKAAQAIRDLLAADKLVSHLMSVSFLTYHTSTPSGM